MRNNKKRINGGASTSREEPVPNKVDEDDFWVNVKINDDEEKASAPPQGATPPPQPRSVRIALDNISVRTDNMALGRDMPRAKGDKEETTCLYQKPRVAHS